MKVQKFGGSSLSTAERITNIAEIIENSIENGTAPAVVVSATGNTTTDLVTAANLAASGNFDYLATFQSIEKRHLEIVRSLLPEKVSVVEKVQSLLGDLRDLLSGVMLVREASPRTLDVIMSYGERLSSYILSEFLLDRGNTVESIDSRSLIRTNDNFGAARINKSETYALIEKKVTARSTIAVITGFIASTKNEETTTLGRGGSDYSAALIAAAANAELLEIWTDVDGVMTADPRHVSKAFPLRNLSYLEAMELSHFGAKVIYPPTMYPALERDIPIKIRNSFNAEAVGTLISREPPPSPRPIKGISSISNISLLRLEGPGIVGVIGVAGRLFNALAVAQINAILITQASSEHSICVAVQDSEAARAAELLSDEFVLELETGKLHPIVTETELSVIAVVGENMRNTPGVSAKLFSALGHNGINVVAIAQGSSELNISVVVPNKHEKKALNALHDAFFLSNHETLNIFLVGAGSVGGELLAQIAKQQEYFRTQLKLDLQVVGIARSKAALFQREGIPLENWQAVFESSASPFSIESLNGEIDKLNLPNSVFVDCTANDEIGDLYTRLIQDGVSIVTPNKKANSGLLTRYKAIKEAAKRRNGFYFYEATVGAGLPVISTIKDLLASGDRIQSIEAVLSGTLSYIFNSLSSKQAFSEIVKSAMEMGYTEPDPRDDLNGVDVARKLLILAREIGLDFEEADVTVENLVPEHLRSLSRGDFIQSLPEIDRGIAERQSKAEAEGKKLRYVGMLTREGARVSLEALGQEHPFFGLSGSDNIIAITTDRYKETPLVVRGPGAGIPVTAAGVLADIIRCR